MGETEMGFLNIFLFAHNLNNLQTKPIFAYVFIFLSSQCESINIWSRKNKQLSDFFYNLINLKELIFE